MKLFFESADEDGVFEVDKMAKVIANKVWENQRYIDDFDKFILDWTKYSLTMYDGVTMKDGNIYNADGSVACTYRYFVRKVMMKLTGM